MSALFDEELERARQVALRFLTSRDRSVLEVRQKLGQKRYSEDVIERVIANLQESRFLDDNAFARRWVETRLQSRPAGARQVEVELRGRGIDGTLVEQVLEEFGEQLGSEATAVDFLKGRAKHYGGLDEMRAKRRMYGLLARRGFDSDTAARAVDEVWEELEESKE